MLRRQAVDLHSSLTKWFRAEIPKHTLQFRALTAPGSTAGISSSSSRPTSGLLKKQRQALNSKSNERDDWKAKGQVKAKAKGKAKEQWKERAARNDSKVTEKNQKDKEDRFESETPLEYLKHRETMKKTFPNGWNPPRKISREAMDGLRALHQHDPQTFDTPILAERFKISPEAVRRILRSTWTPDRQEKAKLLVRERRRKQEYVQKRVDKERKDARERLMELKEVNKKKEKDGLTFR